MRDSVASAAMSLRVPVVVLCLLAAPLAAQARRPAAPSTRPGAVVDPAATVRALAHGEARKGALAVIAHARPEDRTALRRADAVPALLRLALDPQVPFPDRVLAVRAFGALANTAETPQLAPLLDAVKPGAPAGAPADRALAREASRVLQRLGPAALLRPALESTDPEVRAVALEAAGDSPVLCAALSDPWEVLRLAAVRGLSRLPGEADCLAAALDDTSPAVRGAAVGALGDAQVKAAAPALRKVAGDTTGPVLVRAEALAVLGRLGDFGPARTVLETHLDKGGIVPLALGSIAALADSKAPEDRARLRRLLDSKEGAVAARAAHALALLGDKESLDALRALRTRLGPRHRDEVDQALELLGVVAAGEADPADLDDE
jgi:HEAT repeat protein